MTSRSLVAVLALALAGCSLPYSAVRSRYALPPFTAAAGSWRKVDVAMRDGVKLKTHVLLPEGFGRGPVVLMRNPYPYDVLFTLPCGVFVRYGLGCVVQDARGQRESEGEWYPLAHELDDGEDTLAWLVQQPFVDTVALYGQSYLAGTALAASAHLPPQVKTLVLTVFGADLRQSVGERGLFHHDLVSSWVSFIPGRERTADAGDTYRRLLAHRPALDGDVAVVGQEVPFYRRCLEASYPWGALWTDPRTLALAAVPPRITVPVLFIQSMDDPFLPAALDTFDRLGSRERSLLALLPTNHVGLQSGDVVVEGVDGLYSFRLAVPWLLHQLKGEPLPFEDHGVKSWVRHDSEPRLRSEWPGPTREERFVLRAEETATWPCAQHALEPAAASPASAPALVSYRYNPLNPWPSEGGARGIGFVVARSLAPGPVKQTWDCRRGDVVRFATAPLERPRRLLGRMSLALTVRSSAKDTAFVAKLVDIDERGVAVHVTDAAATLRLPTAQDRAWVPYAPGSSRALELDFFPTEWVVPAGHRLGLWVSSSSFPMFSAHPNTEAPWYLETAPLLATQTLELDGPSTLRLRVE